MALERLVQPLQEATKLETRQFTVMLGLRAAAATFIPLLLGAWWGHPEFHWAGIAGFVATTSDKGGAYATRARTFLALLLAGSSAVVLGSLVGPSLWASIVVTFVVVLCGAMVRVLGNEAISVGTVTSVMFLIAQAQPVHGVAASFERGALNAGGIAWAALLALVVWSVRQFSPARKAVGACFDSLAAHVDSTTAQLGEAGTRTWHTLHQKDHTMVRAAIENARTHLAALRGNTRALSDKTAWLLGLVQTCDATFGRVVALTDVLEGVGPKSLPEPIRQELEKQLGQVSAACRALATFAIDENEKASVPRAEISATTLQQQLKDTENLEPLKRAQLAHAGELLGAIDAALETVAPVTNPAKDERSPWWVTLRAAIGFESVEFRHALRVAVLVAGSVAVVGALNIEHGFWATITMLVVLQPHAPATFMRSLQRVGGTVLGSLIAIAITAVVPPAALLPVCAVMAAVSVSVIQVNYALYAALLTPTFLLLAQLNGLDPKLAGLRATTNIAAGVAALMASRLLWPTTEKTRIGDELAKAIEALRVLFHVTARRPRASDAELEAARRRFGLLVGNADVSLQRLVAERTLSEQELEPLITLPLYLRRFCWSAIALMSLPTETPLPESLSQAFDGALEELAAALREHRPPRELSSMGVESELKETLLQGQVARLMQHVSAIHDAEKRLVFHHVVATRVPAEAVP
ncbi:MAG: FUSC family protein [Archangium sp.]